MAAIRQVLTAALTRISADVEKSRMRLTKDFLRHSVYPHSEPIAVCRTGPQPKSDNPSTRKRRPSKTTFVFGCRSSPFKRLISRCPKILHGRADRYHSPEPGIGNHLESDKHAPVLETAIHGGKVVQAILYGGQMMSICLHAIDRMEFLRRGGR